MFIQISFSALNFLTLSDMDTKLVLTGVDYAAAKTNKDLEKQISNSLKKFTGRAVIKGESNVSVKVEPTWLSDMEEVLIAKGWKPPPKKGGRRRSRSESPVRTRSTNPNYKGKNNPQPTR